MVTWYEWPPNPLRWYPIPFRRFHFRHAIIPQAVKTAPSNIPPIIIPGPAPPPVSALQEGLFLWIGQSQVNNLRRRGLTLGRRMIRVMEDLNNQLQQDSFLTFQMGSSIPIPQQQSSCEFHHFLLFYQDKDRNQKFWHHKQSYCRPRKCVSILYYMMLLK